MGHFDNFTEEAFNAYLAGFTDGEGHIAVKQKMGVRITLANCNKEVLDAMRLRLGYGSIRSQQQQEHWRRKYVLMFSSAADCRDFADRIRPYVLIKREAVDFVLDKCRHWDAMLVAFNERNTSIRAAIERGEVQKEIAARHGVSMQTVSRIKLGHTWPSEKPKSARGLRGKVKGFQWPPPSAPSECDAQSTH